MLASYIHRNLDTHVILLIWVTSNIAPSACGRRARWVEGPGRLAGPKLAHKTKTQRSTSPRSGKAWCRNHTLQPSEMFDCPAEESMNGSLHECLSAALWKVDTIAGSREGPCRRPTPKTDPQKPPPMREACLPSCKVLCYTNCCEPESCSKQQRTCMCPAAEMHACHKNLCLLLCSGQFGQLSHTKPCFVSRFRSNHNRMCLSWHARFMVQRTCMRPAAARRRTCVWKVLPPT